MIFEYVSVEVASETKYLAVPFCGLMVQAATLYKIYWISWIKRIRTVSTPSAEGQSGKNPSALHIVLLVLLLVGAFWTRLDYVLGVDIPLHSDMSSFNDRAVSILTLGSFEESGDPVGFLNDSTYRLPLYPLLIALIYKLFGLENYTAVYVMQAFLGTIMVSGVYFLGKRMFNPWVGFGGGLLCATYAPLIGYCGILVSETLFMTLLVLSAASMLYAFQNKSLPWFIATGVLIGLSALTRTVGLPLMLIFLGLFFLYRRPLGLVPFPYQKTIWVVITAFLMILPWTIRNYLEFKEFILLDTATGVNMVVGNNDLAEGDYTQGYDQLPIYTEALAKSSNIVELDRHLTANVKAWIAENPKKYARLVLKRIGYYFVSEDEYYSTKYQWERIPFFAEDANKVTRIVLQVTACVGLLWGLFRAQPYMIMTWLLGAYFYLVPSLMMYHTRYRHPGVPFIFILAVATVWMVLPALFRKRVAAGSGAPIQESPPV